MRRGRLDYGLWWSFESQLVPAWMRVLTFIGHPLRLRRRRAREVTLGGVSPALDTGFGSCLPPSRANVGRGHEAWLYTNGDESPYSVELPGWGATQAR